MPDTIHTDTLHVIHARAAGLDVHSKRARLHLIQQTRTPKTSPRKRQKRLTRNRVRLCANRHRPALLVNHPLQYRPNLSLRAASTLIFRTPTCASLCG